MDFFEDSRKALFSEPNAYMQKFDNESCEKGPRKVVFAEPYENLPNYYINNGFKKGKCEYCGKSKKNEMKPLPKFNLPFDIKSLLPFASMLFKGGGSDISGLLSSLSNGGSMDITKILTSFLSNKDTLSGLFGNVNASKDENSKEMEEFETKNYTRVE